MGRRFIKEKSNLARTLVVHKALHTVTPQDTHDVTNDVNDENMPMPTSNDRQDVAEFLLEAEEDRKQAQLSGKVTLAETGQFSPRQPCSTFSRLKSRLTLQANRYAIFTSPEFKRRQSRQLLQQDPIASPLGLFWTTLDPMYRQQRIEDRLWSWTDGYKDKEHLRQSLIEEAVDGYERDMRRGRYAVGKSKLHQSVKREGSVSVSPCHRGRAGKNQRSAVYHQPVRRSERLRKKDRC